MRLRFLLFSCTLLLLISCNPTDENRYTKPIFENVQQQTYTYADTLKFDFYDVKEDPLDKRPLLVVVHGGGFSVGQRDNPTEVKFSKIMAEMGYTVASISYRLTRKGKETGFGCDCPTQEKLETIKMSGEDVLKALHFLKEKNELFKIDFDRVILIGSSAGAEAVVNLAYMRGSDLYKDLPYGELKFAGVVSFAGALLELESLTTENAVPTMFFHGIKDRLVPYDVAAHHYCEKDAPGYLKLYGSKAMADKLKELKVSYDLGIDPNGTHQWAGIPFSRTDTIASFIHEAVIEQQFIQTNRTLKK